jgi:AcrR family transcriptional regulator
MKPSSSAITRQKLLDVATDVFGELGYQSATVRDIVQRAGVNQASINYHFRGKDALYLEAIRLAFEKVNFLEDVADKEKTITPEQQLRLFMDKMIASLSSAASGSECKFTRLVARELTEPSGIIEDPTQYHAFAVNTVRRFFPTGAHDRQIILATFWLLAQCAIIEQAQLLQSSAEGKMLTVDFLFSVIFNGLSASQKQ